MAIALKVKVVKTQGYVLGKIVAIGPGQMWVEIEKIRV